MLLPDEQKYDPWNAKQDITDVKVIVHCCRYWMLSEWECDKMSFPFWRLYHSRLGGAYVCFEGKETELSPDKIIIIPPYTSFSNRLKQTSNNDTEKISGIKVQSIFEIDEYAKAGLTDQLFIHFNLGFPFDSVNPGIYCYEIDSRISYLIGKIEENRLLNPGKIDFKENVNICCLILSFIDSVPFNSDPSIDNRILKVIKHIDKNISEPLTNEDLCQVVNLATNSFARLFKENIGLSVQKYIQEKRIEHATLLLHHSNLGVDEIADKCGFYDRNHFSKLFKLYTGMAPVQYKKKLRM
jgi:AraC-like DNA-binding protein